MKPFTHHTIDCTSTDRRRGSIFVLAALAIVLIFGFTAFTVDVGYLATAKGQLQNTADAGALAGLIELGEGFGPGSTLTDTQVADAAAQAAVATVAANRAADRNSVFASPTRDVRVGNYSFDTVTGQWVQQWGVAPYNMVEVTLHRDQAGSAVGDGPLDLFFAPVMGTDQASLSVVSTAVLQPGVGIGGPDSGPDNDGFIGVLPITLDQDTWDNLVFNGAGSDNYSYNETTGAITSGPDGIREVNLYPETYGTNPSNRGTLDIGATNNSAADIARQIVHGLNQSDLDAIGGTLTWPRWFNGDPGLSAGIKDELESIKGLPRIIPIFAYTNNGQGGNLDYYVVKFVGIRIMYVKLTGKPNSKRVIIQPAPIVADEIIPGDAEITADTIFTPGTLINN